MRASRLLSILLLLHARGRMTARELAEEVGVSVRTVYRDIDALSTSGIPVYGDPGPTGGYDLLDGYRTRLTGLTEDEAGALFLAGVPGPATELGLGALLATAELKVLAALPPGLRASATLARERFLLDAPGWFRSEDRPSHLAGVAAAVWEQRPLRMHYGGRGGTRERAIDPLGLVLKGGVWYLVARAGNDVRTFRVSRITSLDALPGHVQRPDGFDLAAFWREATNGFLADMQGGRAEVRIFPRGLALLPHLADPWVAQTAMDSAAPPEPDGSVRTVVPFESEDVAVEQFLRFGPDLEVLAPPTLRRRMAEAARTLAALYDEA